MLIVPLIHLISSHLKSDCSFWYNIEIDGSLMIVSVISTYSHVRTCLSSHVSVPKYSFYISIHLHHITNIQSWCSFLSLILSVLAFCDTGSGRTFNDSWSCLKGRVTCTQEKWWLYVKVLVEVEPWIKFRMELHPYILPFGGYGFWKFDEKANMITRNVAQCRYLSFLLCLHMLPFNSFPFGLHCGKWP